ENPAAQRRNGSGFSLAPPLRRYEREPPNSRTTRERIASQDSYEFLSIPWNTDHRRRLRGGGLGGDAHHARSVRLPDHAFDKYGRRLSSGGRQRPEKSLGRAACLSRARIRAQLREHLRRL